MYIYTHTHTKYDVLIHFCKTKPTACLFIIKTVTAVVTVILCATAVVALVGKVSIVVVIVIAVLVVDLALGVRVLEFVF